MGFNTQNNRTCSVSRAANMATVTATPIAITWDTVIHNPNSMWSSGTNPTRITANKPGLYLITAQADWQASTAAATDMYIEIKLNGAAIARATRGSASTVAGASDRIALSYLLKSTDYIEAWVVQSSGGGVNVKGNITVSLLEPQQDWTAATEAV